MKVSKGFFSDITEKKDSAIDSHLADRDMNTHRANFDTLSFILDLNVSFSYGAKIIYT